MPLVHILTEIDSVLRARVRPRGARGGEARRDAMHLAKPHSALWPLDGRGARAVFGGNGREGGQEVKREQRGRHERDVVIDCEEPISTWLECKLTHAVPGVMAKHIEWRAVGKGARALVGGRMPPGAASTQHDRILAAPDPALQLRCRPLGCREREIGSQHQRHAAANAVARIEH
eukprot:2841175-Prymnesium_polylepis.1